MLNSDRLRVLHAVATYGSITAAARALHVTPSGLSQQLAKLEREAGHRLLEPAGRGIRLTSAGHVLAERAGGIVARLRAAEVALDELSGAVAGPLRIGSFSTAARAIMPTALARLTADHPDLVLTLTEGEAEELLPRLGTDELDLVVVESWDNMPTPLPAGVRHQLLAEDMADVALSVRHPLAGRAQIDLHELAGTPWASWTSGSATHDWLVQTLRARELEPRIICTVAEYPGQLALVAANLVAALVPRLGRQPPAGVRMIATRPVIRRRILAVWRTDRERPAVRTGLAAVSAAAEAACPPL